MSAVKNDISELSYEQARDELVQTVAKLEAGSQSLEESMELWQRGEQLAEHCKTLLAGAQAALDASLHPAQDAAAAEDSGA